MREKGIHNTQTKMLSQKNSPEDKAPNVTLQDRSSD